MPQKKISNTSTSKPSPNHKLKSCTPLQATDDLTKLGLADEPTCPRCGGRDDSNIQYVFKCSRFPNIRHTPTDQTLPNCPTTESWLVTWKII